MRRSLAIPIAVASLLLAVPASGTTPADGARQLELVRTTTGPSSYTLTIDHHPSDETTLGLDGFVAAVLLRTSEDGRVERAADGFLTTDDSRQPTGVWIGGEELGPCAAAGQCHSVRTVFGAVTQFHYHDEGGDDGFNRLLVLLDGYRLDPQRDIRLEASGWELHETELDHRSVAWDEVSTLGVSTGVDGADVFVRADAAGGAHGSVAIASPPCSTSHSLGVGLAKGAGVLTLVGGHAEPSLRCPGFGLQALTDASNAPTTWELHGPMAGEHTYSSIRLLVVDLPPCGALRAGVPSADATTGPDCT